MNTALRTRTMQTIDMSASVRPTAYLAGTTSTCALWHGEHRVVASFPATFCPIVADIDSGTGTNAFKRHHQRPEETFL